MNSKERVLSIFNGKEVDRQPYRISIGPKLDSRLSAEYGEGYYESMHFSDIAQVSMWMRWPNVKYVKEEEVTWIEGIVLDELDDVSNYPFPFEEASSSEWYDKIQDTIDEYGDEKPVFVLFPAMLHTMETFRGYDKFFMDVFDNPAKVEELQEKCSAVIETIVRNLCSMDIDGLMIGDDISMESGLMTSPSFIDEYVFKYDFRYLDIAKKAGKIAVYHTDGVIPDEIMDRVVDAGFDAFHPMQPTCNDIDKFAEKYSDRIISYGWLDNTHTIPEQGTDEIREHIKRIKGTLGNRVILSSSDIMANAPLENVEYLLSELKKV